MRPSSDEVDAAIKRLAVIYATIAEAGSLGAPCSSIYLALDSDQRMYDAIERLLLKSGLVVRRNHTLFATEINQ